MGRPSKRNDIVQAAARLFADHGLAAVSINDIAKACGVRAGSVYRLFESKEELFEAALHLVLDEAQTARHGFLSSDATPEEKLKTSIYRSILEHETLSAHRKILQRALVDEDMETLSFLVFKLQADQIQMVTDAIRRIDNERDPYFTFYLLISLTLGYLNFIPLWTMIRRLTTRERDPEYLANTVLEMALPAVKWEAVAILPA